MLNVVRAVRYFNQFYFVFIKKINKLFEHISDNECFKQSPSKIWYSACFLINCDFGFKPGGNERCAKTKFYKIGVLTSNGHKVFCFPYT